jgi:hypothetical protein
VSNANHYNKGILFLDLLVVLFLVELESGHTVATTSPQEV